jgi:hypothetical protein
MLEKVLNWLAGRFMLEKVAHRLAGWQEGREKGTDRGIKTESSLTDNNDEYDEEEGCQWINYCSSFLDEKGPERALTQ